MATFDELIAPFEIRGKNRRRFFLAYQESPDGFAFICEEILRMPGVINPAGLLYTKIIVLREHLEVELEAAGSSDETHASVRSDPRTSGDST